MVKVELSRAKTEATRVYLFAFKTLEPLEPHICPDCKREL
jgi:hypothetical protein